MPEPKVCIGLDPIASLLGFPPNSLLLACCTNGAPLTEEAAIAPPASPHCSLLLTPGLCRLCGPGNRLFLEPEMTAGGKGKLGSSEILVQTLQSPCSGPNSTHSSYGMDQNFLSMRKGASAYARDRNNFYQSPLPCGLSPFPLILPPPQPSGVDFQGAQRG